MKETFKFISGRFGLDTITLSLSVSTKSLQLARVEFCFLKKKKHELMNSDFSLKTYNHFIILHSVHGGIPSNKMLSTLER